MRYRAIGYTNHWKHLGWHIYFISSYTFPKQEALEYCHKLQRANPDDIYIIKPTIKRRWDYS